MPGLQAVADADAVPGAAIGGEFGLKGLDFVAQDIPSGKRDALPGHVHLVLEFQVRKLHIKGRDGHSSTSDHTEESVIIPDIVVRIVFIRG